MQFASFVLVWNDNDLAARQVWLILILPFQRTERIAGRDEAELSGGFDILLAFRDQHRDIRLLLPRC
jgi:hypothetical protein